MQIAQAGNPLLSRHPAILFATKREKMELAIYQALYGGGKVSWPVTLTLLTLKLSIGGPKG